MQTELEQKIRKNILTRNSPNYAKLKTLSICFSLYVFSYIMGNLFNYFFEFDISDSVNARIIEYFTIKIDTSCGIKGFALAVANASFPDLRNLMIVFASGFTFFCATAIALTVVFKGFSFGFSAAYLSEAIASGDIAFKNAQIAFILYIAINVLISTALIYLSSEAVIFGYKFRNLPDYRRTLFRSPR